MITDVVNLDQISG